MRRLGGRRSRIDEGATLVEFALVLPLLLLLLFGVFEFGRYVAVSTAVETASREAARFGSAVGGTTPQYADCAGIKSAGQSLAIVTDLDSIVVEYDEGPGTAVKADCEGGTAPTPATVASGDRIVVTVTEVFESSIPIIGDLIGSMNLSATDARTIFKGSI